MGTTWARNTSDKGYDECDSGTGIMSSSEPSSCSSSPMPRSTLCNETVFRMSEIRDSLNDALAFVHDGTFATSGTIPCAAIPELFVRSPGTVGVPLSHGDAAAIIDIGQKSACADSSIADTWNLKLGLGQFEQQNPQWESMVDASVDSIATELAPRDGASSIRPQLSKLWTESAI